MPAGCLRGRWERNATCGASSSDSLLGTVELLPEHLWPKSRRKRDYVSGVMARAEVGSAYRPARKLWKRRETRYYAPAPDLKLRRKTGRRNVDVNCRRDEPSCGGGRRRRVVFRRLWPRGGCGDGIPSGGERVGIVLTNAEIRPRPRPVSAITPDTPLHEVAINTWMCVERVVTPRQRRWRTGRLFANGQAPRRLV